MVLVTLGERLERIEGLAGTLPAGHPLLDELRGLRDELWRHTTERAALRRELVARELEVRRLTRRLSAVTSG